MAKIAPEQLSQLSDVAAERSILSILLRHQELIYEVFAKITPDDFYNIGNRIIARMIKLYFLEKSTVKKFNIEVLTDILMQENLLSKIGGQEYLEALNILDIPQENLDYYIKRVKFCSLRRKLLQTVKDIEEELFETEEVEDINDFFATQENKVREVLLDNTLVEDVSNLTEITSILEQETKHITIPTLFPALDKELGGGLEGGKLYVIAARSKGFKSTTLLNFAANIGIKQNIPVLYLDTEMDSRSQQQRLLAMTANIPEKRLRQKSLLTNEDMQKLNNVLNYLQGKKIFHKLMPNFSVEQIISFTRRYCLQEGVKLLIFDYIKMPNGNSNLQERQLLGVITSTLKDLASELKIPVLTACQLNRQAVGKDNYNETYIAESDRILWFTDYLFYQRRKTEEEIEEHGRENGTLVIEAGPCRYQCNYIGWFNIEPSLRLTEIKNIDLSLDVLFDV